MFYADLALATLALISFISFAHIVFLVRVMSLFSKKTHLINYCVILACLAFSSITAVASVVIAGKITFVSFISLIISFFVVQISVLIGNISYVNYIKNAFKKPIALEE